jgi:metal-responsive CopG/Arc/MetJ family transcriptional regulator
MSNTEFGVSISDELVEDLDDLTEQCVDLQASRSEVVEAILTAYFQSDIDHEARVRELIIRRRKRTLWLTFFLLQSLQPVLNLFLNDTW